MRLKLASATAYSYYSTSAGAFQSTIVWNAVNIAPGASAQFGPVDSLTNQGATNWSMADQESLANMQGPFATDFTVNLQLAPQLTINFPTGTEAGTNSPTLEYVATPANGASVIGGQFLVYPIATTQASGFAITIPGTIPSGAVSNVTFSGNPQTVEMQSGVVLTQGQTYVCYAAVQETGPEWSPTVSSTFTINLDQPAAPSVAVSQVKTPAGSSTASIVVTGNDNLLSATDASFESSIGTWFAVNADLAQGQTGVTDGAYSLAIQGIATGAASAQSTGYDVVPGNTYSVMGVWTAASGASDATLNLVWLDSSGSSISQDSSLTLAPSSSGIQFYASGVAPSNAVSARPQLYVNDILTAQLAAPGSPAVATSTTGGSIAASVTRYYVATAVDSYGETVGSTEVSIATDSTTATNSNTFTWAAVTGAATYNVYVGTSSGSETQQASGLTSVTYTDSAATLATGKAVPTTNTTGETHYLDSVGIFPGSTPNMVYDSNLTMAMGTPKGTWSLVSASFGTANGDWNVENPGTDQATLVYYGTGAAATGAARLDSEPIAVVPGTTYTLNAAMDGTNLLTGDFMTTSIVDTTDINNNYLGVSVQSGQNQAGSGQWTCPAGVTSVQVYLWLSLYGYENGALAGKTVSWSQVQLTPTNTVLPYAAGPYWTAGGFAGNQQVIVTRSDGFLLRQSPQTVAPVTQQCTFTDSEIPIGFKYTYEVSLYVQL
jgi:hypothetical protein